MKTQFYFQLTKDDHSSKDDFHAVLRKHCIFSTVIYIMFEIKFAYCFESNLLLFEVNITIHCLFLKFVCVCVHSKT